MLTQVRLKELLHYDPLTGIFTWKIVSVKNQVNVGDTTGSKEANGYLVIKIEGQNYKAHRLAWFYTYGKWPKKQLDHKDHIRHHNWINNLREVTNQENCKNKGKNKNNTSGFTGVIWDGSCNKWKAQIKVGGKGKSLGRFTKKADAVEARKAANTKYGFHENHGKTKLKAVA